MTSDIRARIHYVLAVGLVAVPASAAPPDGPAAVAVPAGHKLVAEVTARGVQVYQAAPGKAGGLDWALLGPLADLADAAGTPVGRHYDGPSWEAADGSTVVRDTAVPVMSAPAPDPVAIPWLLVRVKPADGPAGAFRGVVFVQRLRTTGGRAPADPPKRAGTKVGVPYTAVYRLWAKSD